MAEVHAGRGKAYSMRGADTGVVRASSCSRIATCRLLYIVTLTGEASPVVT